MGTVQNGFDLSQYRGELQSENRIDIAVRVKKLTKMSEEVLRYPRSLNFICSIPIIVG